MKAVVFSIGLLLTGLHSSAVNASVFSVGGPLSLNCYDAATARDSRASSIASCSRALEEEALLNRDRAATLVNRGILFMLNGNSRRADADFDAAMGLDPSLADPWLNKAFLRLRLGEGQAALPLLNEALQRNPRHPALAYYARGLAYEQAGNVRAAYADLRRANEIDPDWSLPRKDLARYTTR